MAEENQLTIQQKVKAKQKMSNVFMLSKTILHWYKFWIVNALQMAVSHAPTMEREHTS